MKIINCISKAGVLSFDLSNKGSFIKIPFLQSALLRSVQVANLIKLTEISKNTWQADYIDSFDTKVFRLPIKEYTRLQELFEGSPDEDLNNHIPFEKILPKTDRIIINEDQSFEDIAREELEHLIVKYEMALESAEIELENYRPNKTVKKRIKILNSNDYTAISTKKINDILYSSTASSLGISADSFYNEGDGENDESIYTDNSDNNW